MTTKHKPVQQNPKERVQRATRSDKDPHACDNCGSTFYLQSNAYQYTISAYGVRSASESPQTIYTCIGCGDLIVPGNLQVTSFKGSEREAFLQSVDLAKEYRNKVDPTSLIKNSASITEVEALKADVKRLETLCAGILELLSDQETTEEATSDVVQPEKAVEKVTRRSVRKATDNDSQKQ
jgi:hypothetical protein